MKRYQMIRRILNQEVKEWSQIPFHEVEEGSLGKRNARQFELQGTDH